MCMFMFPMYVYEMDLAKLKKENKKEMGEISSSDEEEKEMLSVVDLPPEVEMKKVPSTTDSALRKKSPKSINDSSSDGDEDNVVGNQKQKELGNGFFGFMRILFKR